MKIFLDDERSAPAGWHHVYTVDALILMFKVHYDFIEVISLDHDLGENQKPGLDFLKWLEFEVHMGNVKKIPELKVHSANPAGAFNMRCAIASIQKYLSEQGK